MSLRKRFLAGEHLTGSFLKIAHTMPSEILGAVGYDFVVIDEEHAPLNRESVDRIILACKAYGMGCLVRIPDAEPSSILSVLDCGADGILVPHVDSAEKAAQIVSAARYRGGSRGYSPTTRAGTFGLNSIATHVAQEDERALVIAMIEDPEAVANIDAIMATQGLDGAFIGRGDLTVAYGQSKPGSEPIKAATKAICASANNNGVGLCAMTDGAQDLLSLVYMGVTCVIVGSDQTFLRNAARDQLTDIRATFPSKKD
jgi:2-keto-3-deoxy-L-rhamnonate aldolase RhmA